MKYSFVKHNRNIRKQLIAESGELLVTKGSDGRNSDFLPLIGQITGEKKGEFACPPHLHSDKDTCYAAGIFIFLLYLLSNCPLP